MTTLSPTVTIPLSVYEQLTDVWASKVVQEYENDRTTGNFIAGGSLDDLD
jgi:hypothetical protein